MEGSSTKHLQVLKCPWQFLKDKKHDISPNISPIFGVVGLDPTMVRRWCAAAAVVLLTLTGQAWVGQTLRSLAQILGCSIFHLIKQAHLLFVFSLHVIPISPRQWYFFWQTARKRGIWSYQNHDDQHGIIMASSCRTHKGPPHHRSLRLARPSKEACQLPTIFSGLQTVDPDLKASGLVLAMTCNDLLRHYESFECTLFFGQ